MKWKLIKKEGEWVVKEIIQINAWSASPEDYEHAENSAKVFPIHPQDKFDLGVRENLGQKIYEGMEVEIYLDHSTPMGARLGQEQYSSIMQQTYGTSARIVFLYDEKNNEAWAAIFREFINQFVPGNGDTYQSSYIDWLRENYEAPIKKKSKIP